MSGQNGKLTVYACGGTGINIGAFFENMRGNPDPGYAEIDVVYVDTSKANLRGKSLEKNVYLIEDRDGSGSIRRENVDPIRAVVPDVLRMHKPSALNIVLSSASGGSGAVIAQVLASQLLADGFDVMAATVGSTENDVQINNTIASLKSLEAITKTRNRPITLMYYQNGGGRPRSEVDMDVRNDILRLAGLFSNQNLELDSADLHNWLNYERVTDFEPKLMAFSIARGMVEPGKAQIVSVASLALTPDDIVHDQVFPYSKTGYVDPSFNANVKLDKPIHYLVLDGVIHSIYQDLQQRKTVSQDTSRARVRTVHSIVSKEDDVSGDGLVL